MRRCAGCGKTVPQRELIRFASREGVLVAGRNEPGRGVYTCRDLECFDRAVERGMFSRDLRGQVRMGPDLRGLYTDGAHG